MAKPKYNQGDLVQYHRNQWSPERHLCVIIEVFKEDGIFFYEALWFKRMAKARYNIKDLDDDEHMTLVVRGQQ